MSWLAKYRHAFLVGLQGNIVYRWDFGLRACFSMLHLLFIFILWVAAYAGHTEIGGFDLASTLTYFVTILIMQFFIGAFNEDFQISEEIRNGIINQFLLKPINYYLYRFAVFMSARVVSGGLAVVALLVLFPLIGDSLNLTPPDTWRVAVGIPAVIMSAIIQFTIAYCFGLLAFWFLEIQSFIVLSYAVETVLGGQVFPLDLMPAVIFRISQFLPYYYQMYFPAAVFNGRIDYAQAVQGLWVQAIWVLLLLGLAKLLWVQGLKRHTAVGG